MSESLNEFRFVPGESSNSISDKADKLFNHQLVPAIADAILEATEELAKANLELDEDADSIVIWAQPNYETESIDFEFYSTNPYVYNEDDKFGEVSVRPTKAYPAISFGAPILADPIRPAHLFSYHVGEALPLSMEMKMRYAEAEGYLKSFGSEYSQHLGHMFEDAIMHLDEDELGDIPFILDVKGFGEDPFLFHEV